MRVPLPAAMTTICTGCERGVDSIMRKLRFLDGWRIIGAALCALALSGCSGFVQLGYNQLPTLAYFQLNRSFDFDEQQEKRVRDDLAKLHAWHRRNELPIYVQALSQLQKEVVQDTTPQALCGHWAQVRDAWARVLEQAQPTAVAIVPTFSEAQRQRMEADFAKRNREWRKTWIDGNRDEQIDKRTERFATNAERVYGDLDEAQLALLRQSLAEQRFDSALTLREIVRRQKEAIAMLTQSAQAPQRTEPLVKAYFSTTVASPDATYRAYSERMREATCALGARLHNATTPAQRAQAQRVLRGYEADLRALIAQQKA
jgi:Family of unknown function (DUF6279)